MATPASAPGTASADDFGLMNALNEGGVISWSVFIILVVMSIGTFYIMFTKFLQQQKIINQGKKVRSSFWNAPNLQATPRASSRPRAPIARSSRTRSWRRTSMAS